MSNIEQPFGGAAGSSLSVTGTASWRWHRIALVLTALTWLIPGLLDREPWKADEAYSYGLIHSLITEGHWLVPMLAGEPFVEKPPLVFWLAAVWAQLPLPGLQPHELARMANVTLALATFLALAWAAQWAGLGRRGAVLAVCALAGTPLFLIVTRYLTADLGLFLAVALHALGTVALLTQRRAAGLLLAASIVIGFLSKGLLMPAAAVLAHALLMLLAPAARTACARREWLIALGTSIIGCALWPAAMYQADPVQFAAWFWDNNVGRFVGRNQLGPPNQRLQVFGGLALSLAPVWLLAVWAVWRRGREQGWALQQWSRWPLLGTALLVVCWLGLVLGSAQARGLYAMPLAVALALLAGSGFAGAAGSVRADGPAGHSTGREALRARVAVILWGLLAVLVVALVLAKVLLVQNRPVTSLGFPAVSISALVLATLTLLAWARAVQVGQRPSLATQAVACLAVLFAVAIGLFLPGANHRSGFKATFAQVAAVLPATASPVGALSAGASTTPGKGCVASLALGESERGMLHYFNGLKTVRFEVAPQAAAQCDYWIEQQRRVDDAARFGCKGGESLLWVQRPENPDDGFRVCRRSATSSAPATTVK